MTPVRLLPSSLRQALAFKAFEIEELADVFFFRPCGALIARTARLLGATPTAVTVLGTIIGIVGGALLYDERWALTGSALVILHSIFDSADGQLARMTGRSTDFGRVLDGVAGYLTHISAFIAISAGYVHRGGSPAIWLLTLAAGLSAVAHAQMYDYFRTFYASVVLKGAVMESSLGIRNAAWAGWLGRRYAALQQWLIGYRQEVDRAIATRSPGGRVPDALRERYGTIFYWPVRGWNLFGDNNRFYALVIATWFHHVEYLFLVILIPLNAAFLWMRVVEARADRRFLDGL